MPTCGAHMIARGIRVCYTRLVKNVAGVPLCALHHALWEDLNIVLKFEPE
jgi:hypothetical protein